jgi:hypothetical protein
LSRYYTHTSEYDDLIHTIPQVKFNLKDEAILCLQNQLKQSYFDTSGDLVLGDFSVRFYYSVEYSYTVDDETTVSGTHENTITFAYDLYVDDFTDSIIYLPSELGLQSNLPTQVNCFKEMNLTLGLTNYDTKVHCKFGDYIINRNWQIISGQAEIIGDNTIVDPTIKVLPGSENIIIRLELSLPLDTDCAIYFQDFLITRSQIDLILVQDDSSPNKYQCIDVAEPIGFEYTINGSPIPENVQQDWEVSPMWWPSPNSKINLKYDRRSDLYSVTARENGEYSMVFYLSEVEGCETSYEEYDFSVGKIPVFNEFCIGEIGRNPTDLIGKQLDEFCHVEAFVNTHPNSGYYFDGTVSFTGGFSYGGGSITTNDISGFAGGSQHFGILFEIDYGQVCYDNSLVPLGQETIFFPANECGCSFGPNLNLFDISVVKEFPTFDLHLNNEIIDESISISKIKDYVHAIESQNNQNFLIILEPKNEFQSEIQIDEQKELDQLLNLIENKVTAKSKVELIDIDIYPNPVKDQAVIEMTLVESSDLKIQVVGLLGNIVYGESYGMLPAGDHRLDLNLAGNESGMYLVKLIAGEQQLIEKIILE